MRGYHMEFRRKLDCLDAEVYVLGMEDGFFSVHIKDSAAVKWSNELPLTVSEVRKAAGEYRLNFFPVPFIRLGASHDDLIYPGDIIGKYKNGSKFVMNPVIFHSQHEEVGDDDVPMIFELRARAQFKALDIDDAIFKLGLHFMKISDDFDSDPDFILGGELNVEKIGKR